MRAQGRVFPPKRESGSLADALQNLSLEGRAWSYWYWVTGWLRLNRTLRRNGPRQRDKIRNVRLHALQMRKLLYQRRWAETELPYLRARIESQELWIDLLWPLAQQGLAFRPQTVRRAQFLQRARALNFPSRDALMQHLAFTGEFADVESRSLNEWADELYGKRKRGRPRKK